MTTFWLAAAAMSVVALSFVLPPLLRRSRPSAATRTRYNVAAYRQRLAELETARALGDLDEPAYGQARAELGRALLADVGDPPGESPGPEPERREPGRRAAWLQVVAMAAVLPAAAAALYLLFGTPAAITGLPGETAGTPSLEEMVARLETRLRASPEDPVGWAMLGRAYAFLGRDAESRDAFAEAVALTPDEPTALVGYAEALIRLEKGRITERARTLVERALAVAPDLQAALWLSGMAAFQRGDDATALARWRRVQALGGLNEAAVRILDEFIARAGGGPSTPAAPTTPATRPAQAPASAGAGIRVRVSLAPGLADRVSPDDVVFVFARAPRGPRMPLAVVRRTVADLPLSITLDDTMAMTPAMRLSEFPRVVVGARVARSGTPTPSPGDLEGWTGPVEVAGAKAVEVSIADAVR